MQISAVLILAAGATASFTKDTRYLKRAVTVGSLDMYTNSNCASPEEPRDTITMENDECYDFEEGFGSFKLNLNEGIPDGCMAAFWDDVGCSGLIQWHNNFEDCSGNVLGNPLWSAWISCPDLNSTTLHH